MLPSVAPAARTEPAGSGSRRPRRGPPALAAVPGGSNPGRPSPVSAPQSAPAAAPVAPKPAKAVSRVRRTEKGKRATREAVEWEEWQALFRQADEADEKGRALAVRLGA